MRAHVRAAVAAGARMLSFGLVYLPGANAGDGRARRGGRGGGGGRDPRRAARAQRGPRPARGDPRDAGRGPPLRRSAARLAPEGARGRAHDRAAPRAPRRGERRARVSFDQYPYGAGRTLLASVLPRWAQEGGAEATLGRLARAADRERIAADMTAGLPGWENLLGTLGPDRITIAAAATPNEAAVGRTLDELAQDRGADPRRGGARPIARVAPGRDDGAPLRGRGGRPRDRRAPPAARRLGRHLRPAPAPASLGDGGAVPRAIRAPGRPRARRRRRSRGSRPALPPSSACPTGGGSHRAPRRPRPARPGALRRHGHVRRPVPRPRRRGRRVGRGRAGVA